PKSEVVQIKVYDILGKEIATLVDDYKSAGSYEVDFSTGSFGDASSLPSGVYFYRMISGSYSETKKMILLR
ncbi:MAG: T9SS type A sorting domain-containing protein, partial [Ignavibacterium sp.]